MTYLDLELDLGRVTNPFDMGSEDNEERAGLGVCF